MNQSQKSIKYGDVLRLGSHILICGDARDRTLLTPLLTQQVITAIISDPPYGVAVTESKRSFQKLKKDKLVTNDHLQSDAEYRQFTKAWLEVITPYLTRKNTCHIFNADKMVFALREGMVDTGFKLSQLLIWVKSHAVVGRLDYAPQHELIAYGWYGKHEFIKAKDKSVLFFPKPNRSSMHPTTKPLTLIRHLILNSTRINDTIYDPFLGSGTTLLACEQTKRICIGIEIDPEYCQTTIDRYHKLTGIKARTYDST